MLNIAAAVQKNYTHNLGAVNTKVSAVISFESEKKIDNLKQNLSLINNNLFSIKSCLKTAIGLG